MADLRELERRFRTSGSVEDEAAWLVERVRTGDLEEPRLRLAAYLGEGAACLAVGVAAAPWTPRTVGPAIQNLRDFDPEADRIVQRTLEELRDAREHGLPERLADLLWPDRGNLCAGGLSRIQRLRRSAAKRLHDPNDPVVVQQEIERAQEALRGALVPWLLARTV